jgi:serine/threonine protein kinase/Tfp pilus assembly protein PilF
MTPERWRQVEQVYHSALEREESQRSSFLKEACADDEVLRREVESLLAHKDQAESFIEVPALETAAKGLATSQHQSLIGRQVGPYKIHSLLGVGGMGEVYLAQDPRLDRAIALKILPAELASDPDRIRRFIREAKAASCLKHPNVATIYEIGKSDAFHFIAMEYVEGQTLAVKINGRPLPIAEIVDIGIQVADAMDEAHRKGITHRDIKPANLMLTSREQVKILDFGLAKVARPESGAKGSDISTVVKTETGVVLGTLQYMSPEQVLGKEVDHRTDIFSLGVLFYEMATGRLPFTGTSSSETMDRILHGKPDAIARFNYNVPAELERIIRKCLEKDRERRYQSARDLLIDLKNLKRDGESVESAGAAESYDKRQMVLMSRRWLAISALVMLVVAALGYLLLFRGAPSAVSPEIRSLAVLPLENLSGDPAQEYFADGMTEALISNLAQIRALSRVISRTSVMRYKGSRKSLQEIAAELKVDAVIEGTVQRSSGRVRVTAKLIPAATDSPVWTRDYERDLSDVLKLQSDVARAVADEIRIQVTPEEQARLAAARSIDPKAHEAYLIGRHHLRTNEDDLRQAIGHFERAIQLVPDYAAAYAGLSEAWATRGVFGAKTRKEVMPLAGDAAVKAVALDPRLPEAHVALVPVKTYDWDWAGAEQEITRALKLDPNSARAHQAYADLLMALGRHAEAIREIERAEQLDPLSSNIQSRYGRVLYRARKYEEAVPHLQRAIDLDPNPGNSMPYWILGELYAEIGRYNEAIASLKEAQSHGGRALQISTTVAGVYARMGKRKEARRMLAELKATTDPASFSNAQAAFAYTALGDKNEAFAVLFRLVEERNNLATFLRDDPPFESLHSDPRWKELLRRMNFPVE